MVTAMESILQPTKNLIKLLKSAVDIVDLSDAKFMHPIELLPVSALISEGSKKYITDTARRLFSEFSYLGVSMNDIAKKLNITKAALYYHFVPE